MLQQLAIGAVEVERDRLRAAAALQPRLRLPRVHHEPVGAHTDERAESRFAGFEPFEPGFFERLGEEALCEVARLVGVEPPGYAEVLVDRLPVPSARSPNAARRVSGLSSRMRWMIESRVAGKPPGVPISP